MHFLRGFCVVVASDPFCKNVLSCMLMAMHLGKVPILVWMDFRILLY